MHKMVNPSASDVYLVLFEVSCNLYVSAPLKMKTLLGAGKTTYFMHDAQINMCLYTAN